jgi:hypothetical protein
MGSEGPITALADQIDERLSDDNKHAHHHPDPAAAPVELQLCELPDDNGMADRVSRTHAGRHVHIGLPMLSTYLSGPACEWTPRAHRNDTVRLHRDARFDQWPVIKRSARYGNEPRTGPAGWRLTGTAQLLI